MKIKVFILLLFLTGANIMSEDMIKTIQIYRGMNPWAGMTSSAAEEEDNKSIKALSLNKEEFSFFENLGKYRINGKELLGRNIKQKKINVEKEFFSDLKKADATRMVKGKNQEMGKVNIKAAGNLNFRELAFFLIESHIITTYWHAEANLSLIKEENPDKYYKAYFKGNHIYFTNEKNVVDYEFFIMIDKETGLMSVGL